MRIFMQQTFVRMRELASTRKRPGRLPFSQATIWRLVAAEKFPAPVRLSAGITAWSLASVETWERERMNAGQTR